MSGGGLHIVLKCFKLFLWFGIQMFDHILLTTFLTCFVTFIPYR